MAQGIPSSGANLPMTGPYLKNPNIPLRHQVESLLHKHGSLTARQISCHLTIGDSPILDGDVRATLGTMKKRYGTVTREKKQNPEKTYSKANALVWHWSLSSKAAAPPQALVYIPYMTRRSRQRQIETLAFKKRQSEARAPQPNFWTRLSESSPQIWESVDMAVNAVTSHADVKEELRSELILGMLEHGWNQSQLALAARAARTRYYQGSLQSRYGMRSIYTPRFDDSQEEFIDTVSVDTLIDAEFLESGVRFGRNPESLLIEREDGLVSWRQQMREDHEFLQEQKGNGIS